MVNWPYEFPGAYWLDEAEEDAVIDALRSRALFRYAGLSKPKHVEKLEAAARDYYDVKHAIAVNSGTGSLRCAVSAFGVGPGDEVIIPSFMWVSTAASVVHANAIPVLCEVDDSFTMDPEDLKRKITPRTKLIIPVHMAGAQCDMDAIMAIADRHGIPVLEDVAQCNGGSFKGKKLGTFGAIGMYSLQFNKNATCGEGGLLVTDDDTLYERAFAVHDRGQVFDGDGEMCDPGAETIRWGEGRRMNELSASVAAVQLGKLPDIVQHMRGSKNRIKAMLSDVPGMTFRRLNDPDGESGPFLVIMLENAEKAVDAVERMKAGGLHNVFQISEYGQHIYYHIATLVRKVPLTSAGNPWSLPENAESVYSYEKGVCPKSDALFERSILIPIPSRLTVELETQAAGVIREAVTAES